MNPLNLWVAGNRTIILSVVAGFLAILLQADYQGLFDMAPMLKLVLQFAMTIILPLIPVYLRKGIDDALSNDKKK